MPVSYNISSVMFLGRSLSNAIFLLVTCELKFRRTFFNTSLTNMSLKTLKLDKNGKFGTLFTPELVLLAELFEKDGHELRIAGGPVRDLLMDTLPKDIDFATPATPSQMKEMFNKAGIRMLNTKGEKHGTITARINDKENFEVTTLRIDTVTDGRHAEVQFTTDWQTDANRRDLTINSMFLGLDGTVYDYFSGIEDVAKRRIVFVGDPAKRIQEDYLRILRYFRFYGRIASDPDAHEVETLEAIKQNTSGLAKISGERIWIELKKILTGKHVDHLVPTMIDAGLSKYIGLPESVSVDVFTSVYNRSKHLDLHPMTLLATLLHDEEEMLRLHGRLKLSADERDMGLFIVEHREDKPHSIPLRPYQALCLKGNKTRVNSERVCEVFKYRGEEEKLEEFRRWQPPKFPINGHLLKQRGMKGGRTFGQALDKLMDLWLNSDFTMTEQELLNNLDTILQDLKSNAAAEKK